MAARQSERLQLRIEKAKPVHSRGLLHRKDVARIRDRQSGNRQRGEGDLHKVRWSVDIAEAQEEDVESYDKRGSRHHRRRVLYNSYSGRTRASLQDNDVPSGDEKSCDYN